MYVEINSRLVSIYIVSRWKQLATVSVLTIHLFYVSIQLISRVHNPVIHNYSFSGQLTVHYYIVFHYLYKALLTYNILPYSTIYTYYFSVIYVPTIKYNFILITCKNITYANMS